MLRQPAITDSQTLQKLIVELDEKNEESLSGGIQVTPAVILLFIPYNQQNSSTDGFRFPCDGPGRGGTC
ncbi:MAG: hypothetical protein KME23_16305 [Goleter apudmare HA4340-LM2]|jgi:hypothetical protein|nr:hypothetical protein [Goleter apudmare HA4340-LM2]